MTTLPKRVAELRERLRVALYNHAPNEQFLALLADLDALCALARPAAGACPSVGLPTGSPCGLRAGHTGWHESADGTTWNGAASVRATVARYSLVQCQFDDPEIVPTIVRAIDDLGERVNALEVIK